MPTLMTTLHRPVSLSRGNEPSRQRERRDGLATRVVVHLMGLRRARVPVFLCGTGLITRPQPSASGRHADEYVVAPYVFLHASLDFNVVWASELEDRWMGDSLMCTGETRDGAELLFNTIAVPAGVGGLLLWACVLTLCCCRFKWSASHNNKRHKSDLPTHLCKFTYNAASKYLRKLSTAAGKCSSPVISMCEIVP